MRPGCELSLLIGGRDKGRMREKLRWRGGESCLEIREYLTSRDWALLCGRLGLCHNSARNISARDVRQHSSLQHRANGYPLLSKAHTAEENIFRIPGRLLQ